MARGLSRLRRVNHETSGDCAAPGRSAAPRRVPRGGERWALGGPDEHRLDSRLRQGREWRAAQRCRGPGEERGDRRGAHGDDRPQRGLRAAGDRTGDLRAPRPPHRERRTAAARGSPDRGHGASRLRSPSRGRRARGRHGDGRQSPAGDTDLGDRNQRDAAADPSPADRQPQLYRSGSACARRVRQPGLREPGRQHHDAENLHRRGAGTGVGQRVRRRRKSEKRPDRQQRQRRRRPGRQPREPLPAKRDPGVSSTDPELQGRVPKGLERDHHGHDPIRGQRLVRGRVLQL